MLVNVLQNGITTQALAICVGVALAMGLLISIVYMLSGTYTKSYVMSLVLLPLIVQTVIMMVNGNLGVGVAVMGAFNLVRFRSIPGSSREITGIFFAMIIGLATGLGYILYAVVIGVVVSLFMMIMGKTKFGEDHSGKKILRVLIPEDLDYTSVFDEVLKEYTSYCQLEQVRTTNLGSMFDIHYSVILKDGKNEKEFLDDLRCRNGNLQITLSRPVSTKVEM
ncbi:MAG: DUF4956 domain-containing protein [Lachnospiraceae bacterium]|nr:DUF4956 domain-containing protein [Lachnospiraceae bacterium]